jgi:hypothetical protein
MKSSYYKGFVLHLLMWKLPVVISQFQRYNSQTPIHREDAYSLSDLIKKQHH